MNAVLTRTVRGTDGTRGVLELWHDGNQVGVWFTQEDDWKDNQPAESCIPAGAYVLKPTLYIKHQMATYEVSGVPGRSRILVHPGNTEEDTMGCVLLGKRYGRFEVRDEDAPGQPKVAKLGVLDSRQAFREFMAVMNGHQSVPLTVQWNPDVAPV